MATRPRFTKQVMSTTKLVRYLIKFMIPGGVTVDAIRAQFVTYCDCDLAAWTSEQLKARNILVFNKVIKELRALPAVEQPLAQNDPASGRLLEKYCEGTKLMGKFALNNGSVETREIVGSTSCI